MALKDHKKKHLGTHTNGKYNDTGCADLFKTYLCINLQNIEKK